MSGNGGYFPNNWVRLVRPAPTKIDREKPKRAPKIDPKVTAEMVLEELRKTPGGSDIIKSLTEKGVKL